MRTCWKSEIVLNKKTLGDLPEVTGFHHRSQLVVIAREGCLLIAAALAGASRTGTRTIDSHNFSICVELLDYHLVLMTRRQAETTQAAGILKGMKNLLVANEVLELGLGLAPKELLQPSSTRLAHLKLGTFRQVGLESLTSTVHRIGLHVVCVIVFLVMSTNRKK